SGEDDLGARARQGAPCGLPRRGGADACARRADDRRTARRRRARARARAGRGALEPRARGARPDLARRCEPTDRQPARDLGVHGQETRPEHPPEARAAVASRGGLAVGGGLPTRRGGGAGMTAALTGSWPLVAVVSRVPLLS